MTEQDLKEFKEHVVEIRYKANPRILDHRGTCAELISEHMELPHWQIDENRIDVFSTDQDLHGFVGFKNDGLTARNAPTRNFFPDKAVKLLRYVFQLKEFGDPIHVERIGVRSRFCTPFEGKFDELRERYSSRFLRLTHEGAAAIGKTAKLIDIGGPLNFADRLGNFNTMSGPMVKKQFSEFFTKAKDFPDVGLYFDIDYFLKPDRKVGSKEIVGNVKDFSFEAWDRHERLRNLIIGG